VALVELESYANPAIAEIVCGRLRAEGIEAVLFDRCMGGMGLGGLLAARVMVDETDKARARRLLDELP